MGEGDGPDDAVGALADGKDGGLVLGGDLEHVTEYVVLDEPAAVAQSRLDALHRASALRQLLLLGRRRLLPSCRTAGTGFRHLRVRRLRPAVHGRIWTTARKGRESGGREEEEGWGFGRFRSDLFFSGCFSRLSRSGFFSLVFII
jgi:hypothetical protein